MLPGEAPTVYSSPNAGYNRHMKSVRTLLIASFIFSAAFLVFSAALTKAVFAREAATHEGERLRASGQVLKEILDIPDDIPKPLLDRAECVIVIPSVKKFAIGIGGSFGRGAMSCRTGKNFTGGWSLYGGARYDIEESKLLRDTVGIGYNCDCFNFRIFYQENRADEDGDIDRSVQFSIDLKSLGGDDGLPSP